MRIYFAKKEPQVCLFLKMILVLSNVLITKLQIIRVITLFMLQRCMGFSTRNANRGNLYLPQPSTDYLKNAFIYNGPEVWNALPNHIRDANTLGTFKIRLKEFLEII